MNKKHLIKALKIKIKDCRSDEDEVSWGMQEGILISKNDAKTILSFLEKKPVNYGGWYEWVAKNAPLNKDKTTEQLSEIFKSGREQ